MRNPNESLTEKLKAVIGGLVSTQAVALGKLSDIPFLSVKIPDDKDAMLDATVLSDMRPAIFNIDFSDETIAICFIRFTLNKNPDFTYTAIFDLNNEMQYNNCHELLAMQRYGLLIASNNVHDFLAFESDFNAEFHPQEMIADARENATSYTQKEFGQVIQAFYDNVRAESELWNRIEPMTPIEHRWYARVKLELQPTNQA